MITELKAPTCRVIVGVSEAVYQFGLGLRRSNTTGGKTT